MQDTTKLIALCFADDYYLAEVLDSSQSPNWYKRRPPTKEREPYKKIVIPMDFQLPKWMGEVLVDETEMLAKLVYNHIKGEWYLCCMNQYGDYINVKLKN